MIQEILGAEVRNAPKGGYEFETEFEICHDPGRTGSGTAQPSVQSPSHCANLGPVRITLQGRK
jgi:hypothetical protein